MRELKFRAYDEQYGMLYGDELESLHTDIFTGLSYGNIFVARKSDYENDWREFEVMQFTGLHDKDGKEIYDGDVFIKVTTGSLFEVYYSENGACFRVKRQDGWHFDLQEIFPINDWKVVGNIHEKFDWNL